MRPLSAAAVWSGASLSVLREPLYLNRWRVYDPRVGRYLSTEYAAVVGRAFHPFAYALSQPLMLFDPDGTWPTCPDGFGCGLWCVIYPEDCVIPPLSDRITECEKRCTAPPPSFACAVSRGPGSCDGACFCECLRRAGALLLYHIDCDPAAETRSGRCNLPVSDI